MRIKPQQVSFNEGEFYIPARMFPGIERYINHGIPPGNFLRAIIKNNLKEAVMYADDENIKNIPAYVNFFYNYAPENCWGSPQELVDWNEGKGLEGREL